MELNVWTSSTVQSMKEVSGKGWSVIVKRGDGTTRTFTPRHVVFAQGFGGGKPIMPTYPGMVSKSFRGVRMVFTMKECRTLLVGRSYTRPNTKVLETTSGRRSSSLVLVHLVSQSFARLRTPAHVYQIDTRSA